MAEDTREERLQVLVVDDEPEIRAGIQELLEAVGFDVCSAGGGQAALDLLSAWAADVVVAEVRVPDMSGFDLLAAIRERYPSISVVLMTARPSPAEELRSLSRGARAYLGKPLNALLLIEAIRSAVGEQTSPG